MGQEDRVAGRERLLKNPLTPRIAFAELAKNVRKIRGESCGDNPAIVNLDNESLLGMLHDGRRVGYRIERRSDQEETQYAGDDGEESRLARLPVHGAGFPRVLSKQFR